MSARLLCFLLATAAPVAAAPRTFAVDPDSSNLFIHVGKTGIGSFAGGHEHEVAALFPRGEVAADFDDLSSSSLDVVVDANAMTVLAKGEPDGDAPKVEQVMKGPQVLDVARFPTVRFRSHRVTWKPLSRDAWEVAVAGELSLHGVTKPIAVPLRVDLHGDTLTATGSFAVKQTDFGIEPVSAAAGLVKVEDQVKITLRINARAQEPAAGAAR